MVFMALSIRIPQGRKAPNARSFGRSAPRRLLSRIGSYFRPANPSLHVEKRTGWLVKQHARNPRVSAFNEIIRLSRVPEEPSKVRSLGENEEVHVNVTPTELVSRKLLFELEKTVLEKGVEEAAIGVSTQYPSLAEILLQKDDYIQFVTNSCTHERWRKNLLQFKETTPDVRAISILLYLRKAYRPANPKKEARTTQKTSYVPDAVA